VYVNRSILEVYGFEACDMEPEYQAVIDFEILDGRKQVTAIKEIIITFSKRGKVFELPQEGYSYEGIVENFDRMRCFGYLRVLTLAKTIFFHISQVIDADPQSDKVYRFVMGKNSRGFCALKMVTVPVVDVPVSSDTVEMETEDVGKAVFRTRRRRVPEQVSTTRH
jgi:cold shock CspA family protein